MINTDTGLDDARRRRSVESALCWGILAVGAILRIASFASGRSLWLDEVQLAMNIIQRDLMALFGPLAYYQAAPVGFVILEKLAVDAFGWSDYSLRLMPLLAALLSLPLFLFLARRCLREGAVATATLMFAVSLPTVWYAGSVKQYEGDIAASLAVTLAAVMSVGTVRPERWLVVWAVLCAATPWFSHASVMVGTGTILSMVLVAAVTGDRRLLARTWTGGALFAVSLGLCYLLSFGHYARMQYFKNCWQSCFMPLPPQSLDDWLWLPSRLYEFLQFSLGASSGAASLMVFLLAAGCVGLFRRRGRQLLLLCVPAVVTVAASAAHVYPLHGRFLLFLLPALFLVIAEGVEETSHRFGRTGPFLKMVLVLLLVAQPVMAAGFNLANPVLEEEIRPVVSYLARHYRQGDTVYLYYGAVPAYRYYAKMLELEEVPVIEGAPGWLYKEDLKRDLDGDVERLRGRRRVWVIFSHVERHHGFDEQSYIRGRLDQVGRTVESCEKTGAAVYLYDTTAGHPLNSPAGAL